MLNFHVKHHPVKGNVSEVFWADWIRTLVGMAT